MWTSGGALGDADMLADGEPLGLILADGLAL